MTRVWIIKGKGVGGILHENEVLDVCPYCTRPVEWADFERKWMKAEIPWITHKCKGCKRKVIITQDITGDIRVSEP